MLKARVNKGNAKRNAKGQKSKKRLIPTVTPRKYRKKYSKRPQRLNSEDLIRIDNKWYMKRKEDDKKI